MNNSTLGHLQVNIRSVNIEFYREFFSFLGWKTLFDTEIEPGKKMLGIGDKNGTSLWFVDPLKEVKNDYDGIGMNHLGISVPDKASVDETVDFLKAHNIQALFETPRHRPEFCGDDKSTYYQVMFESPDRILFEVVYTGPK
jgi:catechol 2,3-dioxygenase-like lactoylglutathione lyase family enzyme